MVPPAEAFMARIFRPFYSDEDWAAARRQKSSVDPGRLTLEKDPFVDGQNWVTSQDWTVTLDELVPNKTMKQRAERDAWYMLGVKEMVNRVRVKR